MSTQDNEQPKSASQIVAEARQTMQEITVAQAREELDQGQTALVLDVREPVEWYADPTTPYAKPELTTKRDARIIVACASGGRSMLAAQTLQSMGYANVVNMAGGFNEWSKQGFPVESYAVGME